MAVLNINWGSADRIAPVLAEITPEDGADAPEAAAPARLDRPVMVYIVAAGDLDAEQKIDRVALDPDNVRIGTKFFRCVKVSPESAAKDPLLSANGKEEPRFVFVTVDHEVAAVVEGKVSGKKIYAGMAKAVKKSFDCSFDKNVKQLRKILNEFDKIANEREVLTQKEGRGVNAAEARKIAKEREELDERQAKAEAEQKELLEVELRPTT